MCMRMYAQATTNRRRVDVNVMTKRCHYEEWIEVLAVMVEHYISSTTARLRPVSLYSEWFKAKWLKDGICANNTKWYWCYFPQIKTHCLVRVSCVCHMTSARKMIFEYACRIYYNKWKQIWQIMVNNNGITAETEQIFAAYGDKLKSKRESAVSSTWLWTHI